MQEPITQTHEHSEIDKPLFLASAVPHKVADGP
jgi:hypothetical protein